MNGQTTEIQKLDREMFLHQQLASGTYGDTKYRILQPLPTPGLVVVIEGPVDKEHPLGERYFFPLGRVLDEVFAFRFEKSRE